jgi:hypothetical protein
MSQLIDERREGGNEVIRVTKGTPEGETEKYSRTIVRLSNLRERELQIGRKADMDVSCQDRCTNKCTSAQSVMR